MRIMCPHCGQMAVSTHVDYEGLTPGACELLAILEDNAGKWVNAQTIAERLFAHDVNGGPQFANDIVRKRVQAIRRKLGVNVIENRHGFGYRLRIDMLAGSDYKAVST